MTVRPGLNAVRLAAALCILSLLGFWTIHVVWLLILLALAGVALAIADLRAVRRQFETLQFLRRLPTFTGRGDEFEVRWTVSASGGEAVRGELRDVAPEAAEPRLVRVAFELTTDIVSAPLFPAKGLASSLDVIAGERRPPFSPSPRPSPPQSHVSRERESPVGEREVLRLPPREFTRTHRFVIPTRGRFTFGPVWIRLHGPFRFLEAQRPIDNRSDIRVLPETFASPDRFQKDAGAEIRMLEKQVFARQQGAGSEFESLKEYRPGDDPRRIDWRATARMQRPIVRRFQVERHRDVMIVIDCGRLMGSETERGSKLDCAVDAGLMLGRVALESGDRCGFALFDHSVRGYLPPVSGVSALQSLVDVVYDARVDWGESDFASLFAALQRRQAKRSLLVILSDVLDSETSETFRGSLVRLAQRHVVLFAALRTPLLDQTIQRPIDAMLDASRCAVAFRLLHEREAAIQTLKHAGIHVLDVEPQQLTVPLINEFIAIRRRNLL